jgi:hypothetical protein
VLVIPVAIYAFLLSIGYLIFLPICWLTTLTLGRIPLAFFGANSSVIRYEARLAGYWDLVSSEWPWGSFGDRPDPATILFESIPDWSTDAMADSSIEGAGGYVAWQLRLPKSARWLLALFLALGLAYEGLVQAGAIPLDHNGYGLGIRFYIRTGTSAGDYNEAVQLANAFRSFSATFNDLTKQGDAKCHSLSCVEGLGDQQANGFRSFGDEVSSLDISSPYSSRAAAIDSDADLLARLYGALYKSSSVQSFQSYSASHGAEILSTTTRFNDEVRALIGDLQEG